MESYYITHYPNISPYKKINTCTIILETLNLTNRNISILNDNTFEGYLYILIKDNALNKLKCNHIKY